MPRLFAPILGIIAKLTNGCALQILDGEEACVGQGACRAKG